MRMLLVWMLLCGLAPSPSAARPLFWMPDDSPLVPLRWDVTEDMARRPVPPSETPDGVVPPPIESPVPVPEPATLTLVGAGLGLVARGLRRRRGSAPTCWCVLS